MQSTTFLLCLILLATITSPIILYQQDVFAQDEDEDKEEQEEEKEEEESEEQQQKDEDKEEESEESSNNEEEKEEEESSSNETAATAVNNTTPEQQIIPDPIISLSPTSAEEVISTTVAEPIVEKKEFNATCKCMTTTGSPVDKPTKPQTPNPNAPIPISKSNIQDSKSFGEVVDPGYTSFYTVPNLLDAIINDVSFWSQAGKSSFYIKLDNALDDYQVCSMELNVYQPKNTPFLLDVGVSQNYTGVLDQPTEKVQFEKCVKNMDEILMIFDNPSGSYVSIAELKLFGSKLGATPTAQPQTTIPTLQPTTSTPTTENATKINIQDSVAEIDIKNSTVTFKFDPMTATFVQSGVQ